MTYTVSIEGSYANPKIAELLLFVWNRVSLTQAFVAVSHLYTSLSVPADVTVVLPVTYTSAPVLIYRELIAVFASVVNVTAFSGTSSPPRRNAFKFFAIKYVSAVSAVINGFSHREPPAQDV
jgi:hypothetical protein